MVLFTATFHKDQEVGIQNGKSISVLHCLLILLVDTVITWTTIDGDDAALSFETSEGCDEFWQLICRFQGRSPNDPISREHDNGEHEMNAESSSSDDEETEEKENSSLPSGFSLASSRSFDFLDGNGNDSGTIEISFPERPELTNLNEVEEAFFQALMVPLLRRRVASILLEYTYIPALLQLFRQCEEFGDEEHLQRLFRIFKYIFLLNNQEILKELMQEDNFLEVAGVFEYDPSFGEVKPDFRTYLSDRQRFKQIIPISDGEIVALIHQTFRLQYFKDVILARILDEESSASFLLTIRLNHMTIVNALDNDPQVLEVMRTLLQSKTMSSGDCLQLLSFFKEFLTLAKTVTLRKGLQIYQPAVMNDFLHFLTGVLQSDEADQSKERQQSRLLAIELLVNFLQHDISAVRGFLMQDSGLLLILIGLFTREETQSALRWQVVTALRLLLDTFSAPPPSAMNPIGSGPSPQLLTQALVQKSTEDFLNLFYPDFACRLLRPLIDLDRTVFDLLDANEHFLKRGFSAELAEILFHLGELLCSFISQHKYRIKYLILRNQLLQNSLLLLRAREKHLQLTGLRVFKSTLATGDEFYHRFFIQHRSFGPLFALYRAAGGSKCDNLVTSAILDVFEYLRSAKPVLTDVVRHVTAYHGDDLASLQPESVFKGIADLEDRIERGIAAVSFDEESDGEGNGNQVIEIKFDADEVRRDEDYFSSVDDTADEEEEVVESEDEEFPEAQFFLVKKSDNEDNEEDAFSALISGSSPTKKTKH